jgi:hypothetical protein
MKNIDAIKKIYTKKIAKKFCGIDDISLCPNKDKCSCKIAAEVKAYMHTVIPSPYYKLDIDDFTGKSDEGRLLSSDTALRVKEKIVKYCWGDSMNLKEFNEIPRQNRNNFSVMDFRRRRCDNVVIFADSETYGASFSKKTGKTFVAALIMQEAIKRRAYPGNLVQTYDWVPFSSLLNSIISGEPEVASYKSSDWLVVDDITGFKSSVNKDAYISSVIDPFFFDRIKDRLPTIMVFRFDIGRLAVSISTKYGTAIEKIVKDKNTFVFSLCEDEKEKNAG